VTIVVFPKDYIAEGDSQMKAFVVKYQTVMALAVTAMVGIGGITLAHQARSGDIEVAELARRDMIEKLDGKPAAATTLEVAFGPSQKDTLHRHAGPVFGYVLEGEYEHAINDEPIKTYKAGDTFYEPTGCVHRVAQNPSDKTRTRLLVVILHPRDVKDVTVWENSGR
jgi:quercetin dioxygenase-like cupin family protein